MSERLAGDWIVVDVNDGMIDWSRVISVKFDCDYEE